MMKHNTLIKVLLVEDDLDCAETIADVLGEHGYHVQIALSFKSALSHINESFDVMISDISLSDGNGFELMRCFKNLVRGIAVSGLPVDRHWAQSIEAGFTAYLTKPVSVKHLLETVHHVVQGEAGSFTDEIPSNVILKRCVG